MITESQIFGNCHIADLVLYSNHNQCEKKQCFPYTGGSAVADGRLFIHLGRYFHNRCHIGWFCHFFHQTEVQIPEHPVFPGTSHFSFRTLAGLSCNIGVESFLFPQLLSVPTALHTGSLKAHDAHVYGMVSIQ